MMRISHFSLKKEEENYNEHGTQQEDRIVLSVDIKGLVGFWNHGDDCDVAAGKLKDLASPWRFDAVSIARIRMPSPIPSLTH